MQTERNLAGEETTACDHVQLLRPLGEESARRRSCDRSTLDTHGSQLSAAAVTGHSTAGR